MNLKSSLAMLLFAILPFSVFATETIDPSLKTTWYTINTGEGRWEASLNILSANPMSGFVDTNFKAIKNNFSIPSLSSRTFGFYTHLSKRAASKYAIFDLTVVRGMSFQAYKHCHFIIETNDGELTNISNGDQNASCNWNQNASGASFFVG